MRGMPGPGEVADLVRRGRAARVDGDEDGARAAFAKAFELAREQRDAEAMGQAALGLASGYVSGTHFGRVPAFLFEAHGLATGVTRTRLAVALARAWAYSGDTARAVPFATEALEGAESSGDAALLAEALDAQLLVHRGPDDLVDRLRITAALNDTVAHLAEPESRMSAHLWRMTTAMEMLDMATVRRQLRALQNLADETGSARIRFFSEARNGMHALVVSDLDAARRHREAAIAAGTKAGEPDVLAIDHALGSVIAVQSEDRTAIAAEAEMYERLARELAHKTVAAEGIPLWVAAGELDRARSQLRQVAGTGLGAIPRDGDWLLVVTCLTESAAATGQLDLAAEGYALLEPYAGRGIANGGAAAFNGVVDGYLSAAAAALGQQEDARRWAQSAAELAEQFGAVWWTRRYRGALGPAAAAAESRWRATLRRASDGVWTIGREDATQAVREMKGFTYLQQLVRQPGVELSALDLSDHAARHAGARFDQASAGEVIDRKALAAYRKRLAEIDAGLDEFRQWGDAARAERLEDEREALLAEVRAATGLSGRVREAGGTAERARVAVRKAVAAAIDKIAEVDAGLGRLLRDCVHTGARCVYDPDPARPVTWLTD
jgi:hypothetical protein